MSRDLSVYTRYSPRIMRDPQEHFRKKRRDPIGHHAPAFPFKREVCLWAENEFPGRILPRRPANNPVIFNPAIPDARAADALPDYGICWLDDLCGQLEQRYFWLAHREFAFSPPSRILFVRKKADRFAAAIKTLGHPGT